MKKTVLGLILASLTLLTLISTHSMARAAVSSELPSDMPVVFVDPPAVDAFPGEIFTVDVKIFNLTDYFYQCDEQWWPGDPLPPPGARLNYSLGNLVGLDIQLSWDPTILDYVGHLAKIPVEDYPDGVLHEPILWVKNDINHTAGAYWLAALSFGPEAIVSNCPDDNVTVFTIAFEVLKLGTCVLNITNSELAIPGTPQYRDAMPEIPHWTLNGQFQTSKLTTAVYFNLNPNPLGVGEIAQLKGILVDEVSHPLPNQTVRLYAAPVGGGFRLVTVMVTDEYGMFMWQAAIPVPSTFVFVAYYPGSTTHKASLNFAILIVQ